MSASSQPRALRGSKLNKLRAAVIIGSLYRRLRNSQEFGDRDEGHLFGISMPHDIFGDSLEDGVPRGSCGGPIALDPDFRPRSGNGKTQCIASEFDIYPECCCDHRKRLTLLGSRFDF